MFPKKGNYFPNGTGTGKGKLSDGNRRRAAG
jgi:hypothetical protein